MRFLLDTHLLIWFARGDARLSQKARGYIQDKENDVYFSAVSVWETAVKFGLRRSDFTLDPGAFRDGLRLHGFMELAVSSEHALVLPTLPKLHRDPFDRLLVAQAVAERMMLLTADRALATYPSTLLV
jgi:PIN domain nuclease of toxin-antitoxin system